MRAVALINIQDVPEGVEPEPGNAVASHGDRGVWSLAHDVTAPSGASGQ